MKLKFDPKRLCPRIVLRPLGFVIVIGICGFLTLKLLLITKQTAHAVTWESYGLRNKSFSEIRTTAGLLVPLNSSAMNLARSLSSFLNGTELTFDAIETKVAPTLFLALSTIPHLSQVSFIGLDGLLFSYHILGDQTIAVYSNFSFPSTWYIQPVNRDTGLLYGTAIASKSMISLNASWFQEALNSTSGYSSVDAAWHNAQENIFSSIVAMDGRGVISLGFPARVVTDCFSAMDFYGGDFHLATADGKVIMRTKLQDIQMVTYKRSVLVQKLMPNGYPVGPVTNLSCASEDGKLSFYDNIMGLKYMFFCSTLQIAGVESVYVLAYSKDGPVSLVSRNRKQSLILHLLMLVAVIISLSIFLFFITKAAKREMFLCAALIKQMNATQQAERKSMNKTFALAKASHDVRASLAGITGLVELCHEDANPKTDLAENLGLIKTCTKDLLGILNSVLEMSKIEAGKMELKEEEFDLAQLLEEVVDLYYHVGIKKGVDIVLDPCDGSILGLCLVRGDRVKLKQILCNLLSNAIKFTSEGHVSVRAVVNKKSFKQDIIASNRNVILKCLSRLFFRNKESFNDINALHSVKENPNLMEFEFEVDDTGKGIPKDKQNSVFEEFVQVKETALGQEGTGLGLGIVQSMVRLMKGEITIVEKEPGEKGTCFKFNILLTICERESVEHNAPRTQNDWPQNGFHQHLASLWNPSPKAEGSHMILFISGEERRRVLKRYIENNLNIKVTIVRQEKVLQQWLKKIKRKIDPIPSCITHSGKLAESSSIDYLTKSASSNSDTGPMDGPLCSQEGHDNNILPYYRKTNSKNSSNFTLIVIDASADSSPELFKTLANFRKEIPTLLCKLVWLDNPIMRSVHLREPEEHLLVPPCDYMINKPFHGSRLIEVLQLLPECSGATQRSFRKLKIGTSSQEVQQSMDSNPSNKLKGSMAEAGTTSSQCPSPQHIVAQSDGKRSKKPLNGKKILVVEDSAAMIKLTTTRITKLGANVEVCTNGKEAFDQVSKILSDVRKEGHSKAFPYDYIIMDCEMPVMDGFEATRLIRKEEKEYDVHIPIIALTAHAMAEEASRRASAGMDCHLTKPLQEEELLDAIQSIDEKLKNS